MSSPGRTLGGRYRLVERIGAGGMAEVYRADDLVLGRTVAIKMLHPGMEDAGNAKQRLRSEVRLLTRLAHPGLVAIYDTGEEAGRAFLVMQLVDGGTLADRLARGPLPPAYVGGIGVELADILAYLHTQNLVHRDLKPSNVLLDAGTGHALLTDFGIARALDATHLTATNTTVGTAAYMAPEQVQGQDVGPAGDVYALGLVLLQCLSGTPVYQGSNIFEVATARLHRQPEIPPAAVTAGLSDLVEAMTQRDPNARPTARQVATRLRGEDSAATDRLGPHGTAALPRESMTGHHAAPFPTAAGLRGLWRRRGTPILFGLRTDVVVGAVAALLVVLAVALVAIGSNGEPQPTPPATPPATGPPGAERLPADLNRLEEAVSPR